MAVAPHLRPLTLDDYLALPEDDHREREIIRGRLFEAPRPFVPHQFVLLNLAEFLRRYVRRRGWHPVQVVLEADLLLDALNTYVSPDLMYFPPAAVPALLDLAAFGRRIHAAVVWSELVVEILSPGSEARDLVEKQRDYQAAGIPHYWVFDPQQRTFQEFALNPWRNEYESRTHPARKRAAGRVRPGHFAGERPPFTLDLSRLWLKPTG